MPKPIFKDNDLVLIVKDNINLMQELDVNIKFEFNFSESKVILISDSEQLSRVFLNLIKNSIESIQEKSLKLANFVGKIDIEINNDDDYIDFIVTDNGIGFSDLRTNIKKILNPYFTTKKKGTGLGLAIVNKIINDHNGSINFIALDEGAKTIIKFLKK
jgi:two-component system nitrogen regulation sensor histidine kinase NtrY